MLTYSRLPASADAARVSLFVIASLLCAHTGAGGAAGGAAGNDGCANFDNARFRRCLKELSPSGYPSMPLTFSDNRFFRMTAKPPKLPTTLTNRFRSTSTPPTNWTWTCFFFCRFCRCNAAFACLRFSRGSGLQCNHSSSDRGSIARSRAKIAVEQGQ